MKCVLAIVVGVGLFFASVPVATADDALPLRVAWFENGDYPQVELTVSLPPEMQGLSADELNFAVVEGGRVPAVTVERVSTQGLEVVLVFDTSGSMLGDPIAAAKSAATEFVSEMPRGARVALVAFGAESSVVSPFTTDHASVAGLIAGLEARGETALYDGLVAASELFSDADGDRRVIVMLSDGGDTVSSADIDDAIEATQSVDAVFHAIELQSPEMDPEPMQQIGLATNGTVVPVADPSALDGIFEGVAAAIVNQYRLSFVAEGRGLTELTVRVESSDVAAALTRVVQFPKPPRTTPPGTQPPVASIPVPPPLEGSQIELGVLATQWALTLGLAALFVGALGMLVSVGGTSRRLPRPKSAFAKVARRGALTDFADRATLVVERTLERRDRRGALDKMLDKAGIRLRAGEFGLLTVSAVVAAFASVRVVAGTLAAVLAAVVTVALVRAFVVVRTDKRRIKFHDQLGDTLQLMVGSLKAGYGLLQAIETVAHEADSPTADEFHRIKVEAQLGRDLQESLHALADRVGSDDIKWVVDAIAIHREVGGDLADILARAAQTIRERDQLRRQVKALSAEGRMSAWILLSLPFALAFITRIFNPDYLSVLTGHSAGRIMIALGLAFMAIGVVWIRKIIEVVF
ncbi:MAG: VWA domain-containing protein [Acidimicrobiia bacterium]|nr:VWA domain-containing protein [Acidimicrobiia bacterium]